MRAISGLDEEGFRARAVRAGPPAEVFSHVLAAEALLTEQALSGPTGEDGLDISVSAKQRQERERALEHFSSAVRTGRPTRTGLGPTEGSEMDVARLFQRAVEHEDEHAAQISALRSQTAATT